MGGHDGARHAARLLRLGLLAVAHLLLVLELAGELLLLLAQGRGGGTPRALRQERGGGRGPRGGVLLALHKGVARVAQVEQVRVVLQVALVPVHLREALSRRSSVIPALSLGAWVWEVEERYKVVIGGISRLSWLPDVGEESPDCLAVPVCVEGM